MKILIALTLVLAAATAHAQVGSPMGPSPTCMPGAYTNNIHSGLSANGDSILILWCDDAHGRWAWGVAGSISSTLTEAGCLLSTPPPAWSLPWLKASWDACISHPMTDDQRTRYYTLLKQWLPHLAVNNGANHSVWTQLPDGTKGAQLLLDGVGQSIAPGKPCDGQRLQGTTTRYHSVAGQTSVTGHVLPAGSFAQCFITYPPTNGWAPYG